MDRWVEDGWMNGKTGKNGTVIRQKKITVLNKNELKTFNNIQSQHCHVPISS